eukprot:11195940-Lingulodinium_polyedra.AAC.1
MALRAGSTSVSCRSIRCRMSRLASSWSASSLTASLKDSVTSGALMVRGLSGRKKEMRSGRCTS